MVINSLFFLLQKKKRFQLSTFKKEVLNHALLSVTLFYPPLPRWEKSCDTANTGHLCDQLKERKEEGKGGEKKNALTSFKSFFFFFLF